MIHVLAEVITRSLAVIVMKRKSIATETLAITCWRKRHGGHEMMCAEVVHLNPLCQHIPVSQIKE